MTSELCLRSELFMAVIRHVMESVQAIVVGTVDSFDHERDKALLHLSIDPFRSLFPASKDKYHKRFMQT